MWLEGELFAKEESLKKYSKQESYSPKILKSPRVSLITPGSRDGKLNRLFVSPVSSAIFELQVPLYLPFSMLKLLYVSYYVL